jgi:DNA-binding transcriptional LysR family regulator
MTNTANDLPLVLAVARAGTLARAAAALGVDASTVFRRLGALEKRLGSRLFERVGGAYHATPAGERMRITAERMEEDVRALERDLLGKDLRLEGHVRVTTSESLAYRLLPSPIKAFRLAHPGISLEVNLDNRRLDLTRREADVAIRAVRPTQGELWGRKLADIAWATYRLRSEQKRPKRRQPRGGTDAALPYIGWDESSQSLRVAQWIEKAAAGNLTYRTGSLLHQLAAAKAGIGRAVLPCYLGDAEPTLVRERRQPIAELADELWIITHIQLKHTARIRAFLDMVGEGLKRERDLIAGHRPRAR